MNSSHVVVGVAGVITLENIDIKKILTVRENLSNPDISKAKDMLAIPMGHLEINENPEDCLRREVLEETGYEITNIKGLLGIYIIKGALGIVYSAEAKKNSDFHSPDTSQIQFINVSELLSNKKSLLRPGITDILKDYQNKIPLMNRNIIKLCFTS